MSIHEHFIGLKKYSPCSSFGGVLGAGVFDTRGNPESERLSGETPFLKTQTPSPPGVLTTEERGLRKSEEFCQIQEIQTPKHLKHLQKHKGETQEGLKVDYEERAAIMEFDGGLPREEAEALAALGGKVDLSLLDTVPSPWREECSKLLTRPAPRTIPQRRWDGIVGHTRALISPISHHMENLAQYRWGLHDIFGCHPTAPEARIDYMGLLLLLSDRITLRGIYQGEILLNTVSGSLQRFQRPLGPLPGQVLLTQVS